MKFKEFLGNTKIETHHMNENNSTYLISGADPTKKEKVLNINVGLYQAFVADEGYVRKYNGNKILVPGEYCKIPLTIDQSGTDFKSVFANHPDFPYSDKYAVIEKEDMIKLIKKHFKNFTKRTDTSWNATKEFIDECIAIQKKTEKKITSAYEKQFQILENTYEFALFFPNSQKEKEEIKTICEKLITAETKTVIEGEGKLTIEQFNIISEKIKKLKNGSYLNKN